LVGDEYLSFVRSFAKAFKEISKKKVKGVHYEVSFDNKKDFDKVFSLGRRLVHPAISIYRYSRDKGPEFSRMGLCTSGKIGIAVKRNRVKRLLREIFRLNKNSLVQKTDFVQVAKGMKFLFLKPMQFHAKVDYKEIVATTKNDIKSFYEVLAVAPFNKKLMVMSVIIVFFGFWDTFVITFLVEFLNKIISNNDNILLQTRLFTGYIFIALLAVPAFGAQLPLIALAKKIGPFFVILSGVLLSGISMLFFGVFNGFFIILFLGIANSIGYAAAMPLAQGEFSDSYNQVYAQKRKLMEIDSNASAAPLKMILNLANVVGLIIGGLLVATV